MRDAFNKNERISSASAQCTQSLCDVSLVLWCKRSKKEGAQRDKQGKCKTFPHLESLSSLRALSHRHAQGKGVLEQQVI